MDSLTTSPSSARGEHRSGFTLIELLVVIAIIAILASLAFPAVQGALGAGKKAQARNDVAQIVSAIKAYQAEYGRLPTTKVSTDNSAEASDGWFDDSSSIMRALTANDDTLNPRKIVFLEPKVASSEDYAKKRGGLVVANGKFYDPFGTSNTYRVKLDTSYDNKMEYYGPSTTENVFSSAIAISFGPNGTQEDPFKSGSDDITSFK